VPVLLILGNYLSQRSGLEWIAYHVFLPALLFQNLASSAVPGAAVLPLPCGCASTTSWASRCSARQAWPPQPVDPGIGHWPCLEPLVTAATTLFFALPRRPPPASWRGSWVPLLS
jgi:hypothetical protein